MKGALLPGNSTVELKDVPVPEPGHGEVLLRMKTSTICGSDIRGIYHEHLGKGPEGYQGVVAGHEPWGQNVAAGPGGRRARAGGAAGLWITYRSRGWDRWPTPPAAFSSRARATRPR